MFCCSGVEDSQSHPDFSRLPSDGTQCYLGCVGLISFLTMRVIIEIASSLDLGIAVFAPSGLSGCFGSYGFLAVTGYLNRDW